MSTAEQKLAQIAAIVGTPTLSPAEGYSTPSDPVPWVTLDYADSASRGKVNRDGNPIAMPAGFVYFGVNHGDLTDAQIVQLLKNTRENARLKYGRVFEYIPDKNGMYQEGKSFPDLVGLIASNDEQMRAEVDALIAKLEQEGAGPVREDFDQ